MKSRSMAVGLWIVMALSLVAAAGCVDADGGTGEERPVASAGGGTVGEEAGDAQAAPAAGAINIAGGTAHIPVMTEVQKRFAATHPAVKISVAGGGSGVGIKQVGEGLVEIGNSGRTPTDEEIETYGLVLHRWAVDGVAVVVHPDNPVGDLSAEQLVRIFAGEITDWQAVGGPAHAIDVYTRDEESGTRKVFVDKALGKGAITGGANVVVSNGAMKSAVAQDPYSIGYVSVGHIDETVGPVALDGVAPTLENVKSGVYPVARGLYSLTKGEPQGVVAEFIAYLYTAEGQEIITAAGFIPVSE